MFIIFLLRTWFENITEIFLESNNILTSVTVIDNFFFKCYFFLPRRIFYFIFNEINIKNRMIGKSVNIFVIFK